MGIGSFPGVTRPGRDVDHPPPSYDGVQDLDAYVKRIDGGVSRHVYEETRLASNEDEDEDSLFQSLILVNQ